MIYLYLNTIYSHYIYSHLKEAIRKAKLGIDIGRQNTEALIPEDMNHHNWMDFAFLVTMLANRDNEPQIMTMIQVIGDIFMHSRTKRV